MQIEYFFCPRKGIHYLLQVGGFFRVLWEPILSSNKTDNNHIHEMLLKVALSTITLTYKENNGARFPHQPSFVYPIWLIDYF